MTIKNKLGLAVAAAIGLTAVAQTSQAANLAADGVGELLYVPYYSTKDGKETYIRLVNNGFDTLIVKLKVREGTNSVDARDFHIFLSPRDMWVGKLASDGEGVFLHTTDTSCTVPDKERGWKGNSQDGYLTRIPAIEKSGTTEGYIVAQVMGTSKAGDFNPFDGNDDVASLAKHVVKIDAEGNKFVSPRNCFVLSEPFLLDNQLGLANPDQLSGLKAQFTEPTNALSASAAIVNPRNGTLTDLPITVVANVWNPGPNGIDGESGYADASENDTASNDTILSVAINEPKENTNVNRVATIFDDLAATATTLSTVDAVTAALMKSSVMNVIDTTGNHSWVVTFPTRAIHGSNNTCSAPFPADCSVEITENGRTSIQRTKADLTQETILLGSGLKHTVANLAFDNIYPTYITNEEESEKGTFDLPPKICFSGTDVEVECPAVNDPDKSVVLNNEVNVIKIGDVNNPLRSDLEAIIPMEMLGGITNGWMQMRFTNAIPITATNISSGAEVSLYGLPAIGFSYTEFSSNGVTNTMSQAHSYTSPFSR